MAEIPKNKEIVHREFHDYERLAVAIENGAPFDTTLDSMGETPNGLLVDKSLLKEIPRNLAIIYGTSKVDNVLSAKIYRYVTIARRLKELGKTEKYLHTINKVIPSILLQYLEMSPERFNMHYPDNSFKATETEDKEAVVVESKLRKRHNNS